MTWGTVALVWLVSIPVVTLFAASLRRSVWWVGLILGVIFGPLGILAVWLDSLTNRSPVSGS